MAGLENSSNLHGERLSAFLALVDAEPSTFACKLSDPRSICIATMRAVRAVRPNPSFYISVCSALIMKMLVGNDGRHG
jgi:hypothetical protein